MLTDDPLRRQVELGLPGEALHDIRMLFVPERPTLVLAFSVGRLGGRIPWLFTKPEAAPHYEDILGLTSEGRHQDDAGEVIGARTPVIGAGAALYFVRFRYRKKGAAVGGSFETLVRMDLSSGRFESWDPRAEGAAHFVPIDLVGTDLGGVYARGSFGVDRPAHPSLRSTEYAIARLDWAERRVSKVCDLPHIFY